MTNLTRHLGGLAAAALGSILLSGAAWAATPMLGCSTGMLFIADQEAEAQPSPYELVFTMTHLPGVVPLVTTRTGYDYCVRYERHRIDEALPPLDTGTLTVVAYKLNEKGRWRKLTRIANVTVSDGEARECKNVKKRLEVGTTVRWVFQISGMPDLDLFDMYELEAAIFTGGTGDLLESQTGSLSKLALLGSN